MLMAGKCIYKAGDTLVKLQAEQLCNAIKNPKPEIEASIRRLRQVREIDIKAYQALKKELPYIVAGIFHPPVRRTENFAWINHFIIDIDHIAEKGFDMSTLKERLKADNRLLIMFESPGQDGLKLIYKLSEKIYDTGKFSLFYKTFVSKFALQNNLEQVVDPRTSDATRACFISHDTDVFYNPDAEPIDANSFVEFDNPFAVKELRAELNEFVKENLPSENKQTSIGQEIDDADLTSIKKRLNPNFRSKKEKHYFVPPEAEQLVPQVTELMGKEGIEVKNVVNISYGKKFVFALGLHQAEINVFYGKKGFSVVVSPRSGTRPELNELCAQLLNQMLFG
jgi:hypothetical protein